ACSTVSVWVAPTRTISPGPVICPTTSPSTATDACDTRCATARMFWSPSSCLRLELVQHPQSSGVGDDSGEGHHKSTDGVGEVLDAPLAGPGVPMQTVSVEFFGAEVGEGCTCQEVGPAVDVVEYDRVRQVARVQFHAPTGWGVLGAWTEQIVAKAHGVRVHGAAQFGLGGHVLGTGGHGRSRDHHRQSGEGRGGEDRQECGEEHTDRGDAYADGRPQIAYLTGGMGEPFQSQWSSTDCVPGWGNGRTISVVPWRGTVPPSPGRDVRENPRRYARNRAGRGVRCAVHRRVRPGAATRRAGVLRRSVRPVGPGASPRT